MTDLEQTSANHRCAPRLPARSALSVPAAMLALPPRLQPRSRAQLDQAVAALRGISTMRADFTQTDRNGQTRVAAC